jgi:hypothetical protein
MRAKLCVGFHVTVVSDWLRNIVVLDPEKCIYTSMVQIDVNACWNAGLQW